MLSLHYHHEEFANKLFKTNTLMSKIDQSTMLFCIWKKIIVMKFISYKSTPKYIHETICCKLSLLILLHCLFWYIFSLHLRFSGLFNSYYPARVKKLQKICACHCLRWFFFYRLFLLKYSHKLDSGWVEIKELCKIYRGQSTINFIARISMDAFYTWTN